MKFLKLLRTKLLIAKAKRELAEHRASVETLSKARDRYKKALDEDKYSMEIKQSLRSKVFSLAGEVVCHKLQIENLLIHIELLEDSLKC